MPRAASTTPAHASSGPTHANGTREIASSTIPKTVNETARV